VPFAALSTVSKDNTKGVSAEKLEDIKPIFE